MKILFLLFSILLLIAAQKEDIVESDEFYKDFEQLQKILNEMDNLSKFIMNEDEAAEEMDKISKQLDDYESAIKFITKNYQDLDQNFENPKEDDFIKIEPSQYGEKLNDL